MKAALGALSAAALALVLGISMTVPASADEQSLDDQIFDKWADVQSAKRVEEDPVQNAIRQDVAAQAKKAVEDGQKQLDGARKSRDAKEAELQKARRDLEEFKPSESASDAFNRLQRDSYEKGVKRAEAELEQAKTDVTEAEAKLEKAKEDLAALPKDSATLQMELEALQKQRDELAAKEEQSTEGTGSAAAESSGSIVVGGAPPPPDTQIGSTPPADPQVTPPSPPGGSQPTGPAPDPATLKAEITRALADGWSALGAMATALKDCNREAFEAARQRITGPASGAGDGQAPVLLRLAAIADLTLPGLQAAGAQPDGDVNASAVSALNWIAGYWKLLEILWAKTCGEGAACVAPPAVVAASGGDPGRGSGFPPPPPPINPKPKDPGGQPDPGGPQPAGGSGGGAPGGQPPCPDNPELTFYREWLAETEIRIQSREQVLRDPTAGPRTRETASRQLEQMQEASDYLRTRIKDLEDEECQRQQALAQQPAPPPATLAAPVDADAGSQTPEAFVGPGSAQQLVSTAARDTRPEARQQATRDLAEVMRRAFNGGDRDTLVAVVDAIDALGAGAGPFQTTRGAALNMIEVLDAPDPAAALQAIGRRAQGQKIRDAFRTDAEALTGQVGGRAVPFNVREALVMLRARYQTVLTAELAAVRAVTRPQGRPTGGQLLGVPYDAEARRRYVDELCRRAAIIAGYSKGIQRAMAEALMSPGAIAGATPPETPAERVFRRAMQDQLQQFPVLGETVDGRPLWRVLADLCAKPDAVEQIEAVIDQANNQRAATIVEHYHAFSQLRSAPQLLQFFGSPTLRSFVTQWAQEAVATGVYDVAGANSLIGLLYSTYEFGKAQGDADEFTTRLALSGVQVGLGVIMLVFPPSVVVLGPAQALLAGAQIGLDARKSSAIGTQLSLAQQAVTAGTGDRAGLARLEQEKARQDFMLGVSVVLEPLGLGLDVIPAIRYVGTGRPFFAWEGIRRAADPAIGAGSALARTDDAAAGSGGLRTAVPPANVLDNIDPRVLNIPRYLGNPGDAAFFRAHGLVPQRTLQIGGQTFHLTDPFIGPGGRISVIAFQETTAGTFVPRTFYLSGEHGTWRAATGYGRGLVFKGPVDDVPGKLAFVNESAADLTGELQSVLGQWVTERGILTLPDDVARRAFLGHLDFNHELGLYVNRADVNLSLPPGARPDFAAGPLDRWTFQSPLYGPVEGFLYRSTDGSALYIVLRDQAGRVWVPGIQVEGAGLTPFGTRWEAIKSDLTTTPKIHNPEFDETLPVSLTNPAYIDNPSYRNPLNELFASGLPGPDASRVTAASRTAPSASGTPTTAGAGPAGQAGGGAPTTGSSGAAAGGATVIRGGKYVIHLAGSESDQTGGTAIAGTGQSGGPGPFTIMVQAHMLCWYRLFMPIPLPFGGWLIAFDTNHPGFFQRAQTQDRRISYVEENKPLGPEGR